MTSAPDYCVERLRPCRPRRYAPIRAAGRFAHGAVVWHRGVLYETEDQRDDACLYRYLPDRLPLRSGELAGSTGRLRALAIAGLPNACMKAGWPVGRRFPVTWVKIDDADPPADTVRREAAAKGAAAFDRPGGCWIGDGRLHFRSATAGPDAAGPVWELDPRRETLMRLR